MAGCAVAGRTLLSYREQPARPWPLVHNPAMGVTNAMPADRYNRQDGHETASIRDLKPRHRSDYRRHRRPPSPQHASQEGDKQVQRDDSNENNSLLMIPQVWNPHGAGHERRKEAQAVTLYRPPEHLLAANSYYQLLQERNYGRGREEEGSMWAGYLKHTAFARQLLKQYARPDILYLLRQSGIHRDAVNGRKIVLFVPVDYAVRNREFCGKEGMRVMQHIVVLESSEEKASRMMEAGEGGQATYESAAGNLLLLSRQSSNAAMTVQSGSMASQTARIIRSMLFPCGTIHVIDRMLELPLRSPEHVDKQLARTTLASVLAKAIGRKGESRGERRLAEAEQEKDKRLTVFVYNQSNWPQLSAAELSMHVVGGVYTSTSFPIDLAAPSHAKSSIYVEPRSGNDGGWTVNGRRVIRADILTTWGVIHVLDGPIPMDYIPEETAVSANTDHLVNDNHGGQDPHTYPIVIAPEIDDLSLDVKSRPLAKPQVAANNVRTG